MSDWYVSSAAYATYTAFAASHAYIIGDIIVPTAPAVQQKYAFRCTTAGTSSTEPTWPGNNNATVTSGTATFTNITGQSTFFWTAAAGDLQTINGTVSALRYAAGDRVFLSSDHSETTNGGNYGSGGAIAIGYGLVQFLCVNRAGSTPPVAADLTTGAAIIASSTLTFRTRVNVYQYGIAFSSTNNAGITFGSGTTGIEKTAYFSNCQLRLNSAGSSPTIIGNNTKVIFDNTTFQVGNAAQSIDVSTFEIVWINTPTAIVGGTVPTVLFTGTAGNLENTVTARGVDFSAVTGTLMQNTGAIANRYLFDSCRIASGVTRYNNAGSNTTDILELVNCYDGTNIISESYQPAGTLTTETTITLNGGAADDVGSFSHKIVTGTNIDKFANTFSSFWMDVENTSTGVSKTATVEIISSTALNNDEIALYLQYEGTAGSSVASFGTNFTGAIATPGAVTTSTATWNSSPSTPQKQKCQVTFTPQHAGRLRGQIRVGKASCTVYINPQIAVS